MTPDENREFERRIEQDPELAKEVELHHKLHRELEPSRISAFRTMLEEEAESMQTKTKVRTIGRRRLLSIAASLAVIAVTGTILFTARSTTSQALYGQFYESPSLAFDPSTVRGESDQEVLQNVSNLFARVNQLSQQGQYEQALEEINSQRITIPNGLNDEVFFRQAILHLNLEQPEVAMTYLDQLTSRQESARWYKTLALLKLNRLAEIPMQLEPLTQYDNPRRDAANRLLRKLNRVK